VVAKLAEDCIKEDIPLLVEPVSYPVDRDEMNSSKFAERKPELVIETARQITAIPIDVLKAEFPADVKLEQDEAKLLGFCRELDMASRLPWVLLSAGVDFDTFRKQVEVACRAGASGFLAGRALWQEGAQIRSRGERMNFFKNTAAKRLKELTDIAAKHGRPWYVKLGVKPGEFASVDENWYKNY
jgi:tagatose 1,6-diphosphate aldolase